MLQQSAGNTIVCTPCAGAAESSLVERAVSSRPDHFVMLRSLMLLNIMTGLHRFTQSGSPALPTNAVLPC